jgi:hypothetical protein
LVNCFVDICVQRCFIVTCNNTGSDSGCCRPR